MEDQYQELYERLIALGCIEDAHYVNENYLAARGNDAAMSELLSSLEDLVAERDTEAG